MKKKIKKLFFRLYRLVKFRNKVFGKIGKNNFFDWSVYINEDATIGNNNYFGPYVMVNNAIIGNYCSIAPSVKIGQGKHSIEFYTTYQKLSKKMINFSLNTTPTKIGNDVWIGANAIIMQDVTIGDGAVIGANAVVTKNIDDYAIAIGVPARTIKYRFTKDQIENIKKSKWFELEFDEAIEELEKLKGG